jgi:hypothetical protein
MVVVLEDVVNTSWPMKLPAVRPPPGRFATVTLTVTGEGAVPLADEIWSQLPPSEVLVDALQVSDPAPPFRTCTVWLVNAVPPVTSE